MKRIVVCFTLLSVLLVACQLAGTPSVVTPTPPAARPSPARGYCGDGRCDGPENPQNRPADCEAGEQAIDFSTIIEGEVRCVDGETGAEFLQPAERLRVAEVPIVCRRAGSETVDLRGAQVELWTLEELGPAELVRQVAAAGANLIILRVFDYEDEPNPGVYFRTEHAPVKEDLLSALLAQARPAGLRVFAWMTTLNLPWVLQEHPDWAIVGYDWDKEQYTLATGWYRRVSPFVPEFIDYLKGLYQDLARYDLDGIMFQDDLYLGDNEDFNYYAASAYFERFGRWPRIERFYDDKGNPTAEGEEWIKWKAERLMEVAREIMEAVRSINPGMEFGLDAYWETVLEPENGRKWFSQDARLALESKFDYLIVMSYHRSLAKEDGLTIEQALDLLGLMTKRGLELVGEALVMKAQVADFDEDEVLPSSEIEGALAAIKGAGCRNIVYYPHRADLPFELIRKYFADLCSSSKVYLPLVATHAPAGPVNLTADSPANDQNPAWSPDGERILFTSGRSGNNELWLMDSDGSAPTALTSNGAENVNLPGRAWCPANDRIVFASDVESENDEIFSIASDGSDRQRLTTTDVRNLIGNLREDSNAIIYQADAAVFGRPAVRAKGGAHVPTPSGRQQMSGV